MIRRIISLYRWGVNGSMYKLIVCVSKNSGASMFVFESPPYTKKWFVNVSFDDRYKSGVWVKIQTLGRWVLKHAEMLICDWSSESGDVKPIRLKVL